MLDKFQLRELGKDEVIPYNLLLLADETIDAIDRYIFNSRIFVLELNHNLVAIYVLQVIDQDSIEIKNIAVVESFQGQGIGKALLQDVFERAQTDGYSFVLVGTGDASHRQLKLYQSVGFRKCDVIENFFLLNYPSPIFENGIQLKNMILLRRDIP